MSDFSYIARNLAEVRNDLASIAAASGRDLPTLVCVTKSGSDEELEALVSAGATDIGENRPQELVRRAKLEKLTEDRAIAIPELEKELQKYDAPIYLTGDGYDMTTSGFKSIRCKNTPVPQRYQSGYWVAMCALKKYNNGIRTSDKELTATYLRLPQAERERLEKEKNN